MQRRVPNVVVLAVSIDEDAAAYRQFMTDNHIDLFTGPRWREEEQQALRDVSLSETYIIDQDGVMSGNSSARRTG